MSCGYDDPVTVEDTATSGSQFWRSFLLAVEAEPRQATEVRGSSGLFHPAIAVGVDDTRRRIVLVSADADARAAAFAQHDVQAANPTYRVMVARPVAVNLSTVAAAVTSLLGTTSLGAPEFERFSALLPRDTASAKTIDPMLIPLAQGLEVGLRGFFHQSAVGIFPILHEALKQLSNVHVELPDTPSDSRTFDSVFHLDALAATDPMVLDRRVGNCPVPLYELDESAAAVLHSGRDIDHVRDVLRRMQLFQYFYPAPDHLVLGVADRGGSTPAVDEALAQAPVVGHPLGAFELLPPGTRIQDIVAALQDRKYLVEGELGLELSEQGQTARASVKFKPREGFLAKLSRILSIKIDANLTDLFK